MIKAMILAAGLGTRLGQLTRHCPKPLLSLGGRPLLEYTLSMLKRHGIREVVINTHDDSWSFYEHFGGPVGEYDGMEIRYSWEKELLGTGGAVRKAIDHFDEPFWVIYGDNLLDVGLFPLDYAFDSEQADMVIGRFMSPDPCQASVMEWALDGRVTSFIEKPQWVWSSAYEEAVSNAGIYLIKPSLIRAIPEGTVCDFGADLIPQWVKSHKVYCRLLTGTIQDIGTPAGYHKARRLTRWPWQRRRLLRKHQ